MQLADVHTNSFALLITPDAVFTALEKSDCLRTLARRVCKPLDDREAKQAALQVATPGKSMRRFG